MLLKTLLVIVLLCITSISFGQKFDTVYHRKHFNFVKYFPSGPARTLDDTTGIEDKALCFGNYSDSLKNGEWVYFYPSGDVLAIGKFKNGLKSGRWRYYSNGTENVVIFKKGIVVTDMIVFDNKGFPQIVDKIQHIKANTYSELINGKSKPRTSHILD